MIHVRFADEGKGKLLLGHVEIDGVDVSRYITGIKFEGSPLAGYTLDLVAVIGKDGDQVELELPDDALRLTARVRTHGELIDVTPVDTEGAKRLLLSQAGH